MILNLDTWEIDFTSKKAKEEKGFLLDPKK